MHWEGRAVPVLIGFLASLLGIGGLADRILGVIRKIPGLTTPVYSSIDKRHFFYVRGHLFHIFK